MRTPAFTSVLLLCAAVLLFAGPAFGQEANDAPVAVSTDGEVKANEKTSSLVTSTESNSAVKVNKGSSSLFRAPAPPLPQPSDSDKWHFESAPYLWMASLEGDLRVANNTVHVESSFSDVLKQLDFAFATRFEASKRRWTIMIDENYINLGTVGTGPLGQSTEVEPTLNFLEGGASFAALVVPNKDATAAEPLPPVFSLEALGGIRYTHFGLGLERTNLNVEGSRNLVDAFGGFRIKGRPHPAVTLIPKFTIGGGGTNLTWTFSGLIDVRPKKSFSIWGGYQVMDMDADQTSNRIGFNGQMRGPIIGVTLYK